MTAPKPFLSVVIPNFNSEPFLAECLQSILSQGFSDLEILVVDDGSTDRSLEIVHSFPKVRCLSQSHSGPAAARNLGIGQARGNLLAFNDADDVWPPGRLAAMLRHFSAEPDLQMVIGRMQWVGAKVWKEDGTPDRRGQPFSAFGFGASLIRREVFGRVGLLNPDYRRGEDTEWFIRTREQGIRARLTDETVLYYRRHDRNATADPKPVGPLTLQILKASLDRRRGQDPGEPPSLVPVETDLRLKPGGKPRA